MSIYEQLPLQEFVGTRWASGTAFTHGRDEEKYTPGWSFALITEPIKYEKK